MRLINTTTLQLSEFMGINVPRYAILTHTWEEEEVSYQDWLSWERTGDEAISRRKGFRKIQGACRQALKNHLDWLWVDTNCIDKTSSAELSEAINSMYAWYRDARICYGYLADVASPGPSGAETLREIERSRWFTRGWTLQELLAPRLLIFFSNTWAKLGHRSGILVNTIARATKIPREYLITPSNVHLASDARKMSWLSWRETTRVEDMAYCMLGLFGINMPLLYGEGTKAFIRLQEEIIRSHHDHTIFCWNWMPEEVPSSWASMLAPSPRVFGAGWRYTVQTHDMNPLPYSVTNIGLSISLPVFYTLHGVVAVLDAANSPGRTDKRSCIFLQRASDRSSVFWRRELPSIPIDLWPAQLDQGRVHLHVIATHGPLRTTDLHLQRRYDNNDVDRLRGLNRGRTMGRETTSLLHAALPPSMAAPFAVLPFIEPSVEEFFIPDEACNILWSNRPGTERPPLATRKLQVMGVPQGAYDYFFDRIELAPWRATDIPNYASMLAVKTPGILDTYYFLFAVQETEQDAVWFCDITTEKQLVLKGINWDADKGRLEDLFATWVKHAAANWRDRTKAEASDGLGLHLTLGDRLQTWTRLEHRPAILSRNKTLPFNS